MKNILRIIIALIFIASGFVKAVDVVGFSFKLEEYFSPSVFNLPFFEKFSLPIAIFVVALELILGFMLLLKVRLKFTLTALIGLCVFFAFLTFYSAYFNKVTDCGCFGDAIKFTPWQSFVKDLILLFGLLTLWLFYRKNSVETNNRKSLRNSALMISIVATAFFIGYGILYEPMIDFRDYKIGTNLNTERQKIEQDPSVYKTFYLLKNKKTGEEKEVNQDDYVNDKSYWEEGTVWEIVPDKNDSKLMKQGYSSEISKFKLEDETGNDITENILNQPKVILLFSYNPNEFLKHKTKSTRFKQAFEKKINNQRITVYEVSPENNRLTNFPKLFMDATAIKTIGRSNPLVLVLNKGKIVEKIPALDYIN